MPPILTILLAHRGANAAVDDDWTLRDDAAKFLSVLCVRYAYSLFVTINRVKIVSLLCLTSLSLFCVVRFGSKYTNLQPRVTRTLLQVN